MIKPPKSKIAIALYVVGFLFACGFAVALYQFNQLPGDTREGTMAKISVLRTVRNTGFTAITILVFGHVVPMIADIRWKLFEGGSNA